jgi:hypothetical protein
LSWLFPSRDGVAIVQAGHAEMTKAHVGAVGR